KAKKVMLLYPGNKTSSNFRNFENEFDDPKHQCKIGFVFVLDDMNKLDTNIAQNIISQLEI
ncbi:restriction endonuclease, partial [Aquimarina celericrescens]|nr:restriction endonuclease [Aquimarina celericrescens]